MRRSLRSRITQSDGTFVISLVAVTLIWMMGHWTDAVRWTAFALAAVTSYILLEMNNRSHLLRVRSRMVSSSYLVLVGALSMLHDAPLLLIAPTLLAWANLLMFDAYQQRVTTGVMLYAHIFFGIASCFFPPLLLMLPMVWFCSGHHLRILSFRSWLASLMGTALPFIYLMIWHLWQGTLFLAAESAAPQSTSFESVSPLSTSFLTPAFWQPYLAFDFTPQHWAPLLRLEVLVPLGFIALLFAWSAGHYRATIYRDNMRTRMTFSVISIEALSLLALLLVWPMYWQAVLALSLVVVAPFAAHYFTLSETRWQDFWCLLWCLLFIALALFCQGFMHL